MAGNTSRGGGGRTSPGYCCQGVCVCEPVLCLCGCGCLWAGAVFVWVWVFVGGYVVKEAGYTVVVQVHRFYTCTQSPFPPLSHPFAPPPPQVRHGPNTHTITSLTFTQQADDGTWHPLPALPAPGASWQGVRATVQLGKDDQGLAPGQFAVFYHEGVCLGSAVIQ